MRPPAKLSTFMKLFVPPVLFVATLSPSFARAEPVTEPVAERYYERGELPSGAGAVCTIVYYNFCSGWMLTYPELEMAERIGVVYDLASECSGGSGHECENLANYWYWSVNPAGYMSPVQYMLWEVDENDCLVGVPEPTTHTDVPGLGWNMIPGLGTVAVDRIALVALKLGGNDLRPVFDDNVKNAAGGPACAGIGPGNGKSYQFRPGGIGVPYNCPPVPYEDAAGPLDLLVRSVWSCQTPTGVAGSGVESTTWSDLKELFQ